MDAQQEQHGNDSEQHGGDPVAADIESRNPDTGDVVAGEQVLDEGHIAPDQEGDENSPPSEGGTSQASTSGGGTSDGSTRGQDVEATPDDDAAPDQDAGPSRMSGHRPEQPAEGADDVDTA